MSSILGDKGTTVNKRQTTVAAVLAGLILVGGAAYFLTGSSSNQRGHSDRTTLVETVRAEERQLNIRIEAVGSTLAKQAIDIVAQVSGPLIEIKFEPGQRVAKGDVLARLEQKTEQASVAEARASAIQANLALKRARSLRAKRNISAATVEERQAAALRAKAQLEQAEERLAKRTIRAPFAGQVGLKRVHVGAQVDVNIILTTLDDLSQVEIDFAVPERFYGQIKKGQNISAKSAAFPDRIFTGVISSIDTRVGEVSRAFKVRALVPNNDGSLPAGMFMHVDVTLEAHKGVVVPEQAVIANAEHHIIYTVVDNVAHKNEVQLGRREVGIVEVLSGIKPGDVVVTSGLQRLRDGVRVKIVSPQSALEPVSPVSQVKKSANAG